MDADITVTTATQTADEVLAHLPSDAQAGPAPEIPAPPPEQPDADAPPPPTEPEIEEEAASSKPDTAVSDAARTLRAARGLAPRISRLESENALHEATIKRLGGAVTALETREYKTPQAKLDHLAKRRHELLDQTERLLRQAPAPAPAAPPRPATPDVAPAAPAVPFKFESWEQYQESHPESEYTEYLFAVSDAREAWKETQREERRQMDEARAAVARDLDAVRTATDAFQVEHPDYAEMLATPLPVDQYPQQAALVRELLLRAGANAPALVYHLGKNPEDATRLLTAPSRDAVIRVFGQIEYAASQAARSAPAPAAPRSVSRPRTSAPAPLAPVGGAAVTTRSLQALAAESEDADAYIEERRRQQRTG